MYVLMGRGEEDSMKSLEQKSGGKESSVVGVFPRRFVISELPNPRSVLQ